MNYLKPVDGGRYRYSHIIGTGGIGSGMFFKLEGNHTLGRNESRMGRLLQFKDYCKLHIISHYISVLLGAGSGSGFKTYPIGKVGNDETGRKLVDEIKQAGMETKYIEVMQECSTLFSVCFQYPDNTGGNITTADSSSSKVVPGDIERFFDEYDGEGQDELILAVPEVPLETRLALLEYGKKRGSYNTASVLSSEIEEFRSLGGFEKTDLLSVNIDEARNIADMTCESHTTREVIDACTRYLADINQNITILITDGPNGSYSFRNGYVEHTPVPDIEVVATAGAGDAFLAATISGLCCGLPLSKGRSDRFFSETPLVSAVELGTLLASLSVTSPDAIHQHADGRLLYEFAVKSSICMSPLFSSLFADCAR